MIPGVDKLTKKIGDLIDLLSDFKQLLCSLNNNISYLNDKLDKLDMKDLNKE